MQKIIDALASYLQKKVIRKHFGDHTDIVVKQLYQRKVDLEVFKEISSELFSVMDWGLAPEWANFRTTNNDGDVTYWEYMPECTLLGFWVHGEKYGRIEVVEIKKGHLQKRPKQIIE
jgi:hypothetical protein